MCGRGGREGSVQGGVAGPDWASEQRWCGEEEEGADKRARGVSE
jgi:hypothetical protein